MSFINRFVNSWISKSNYSKNDAVIEVKPSYYSNFETFDREDSLFIYTLLNSLEKPDTQTFKYEVVLLKNTSSKLDTAYSLYRSHNLEEIKYIFKILSDKLPILLNLCPQLINENNLQGILDYIKSYPGHSLLHVCSHFGYNDYFKADNSLNFVDRDKLICPLTNLTPIHLAVQAKNLQILTVLMSYEFLNELAFLIEDHDFNNIFHSAASTNKEIITVLCTEKPLSYSESKDQTSTENEQLISKNEERKKRISYLINKRNKNNETPLYIACSLDKPENVKAFLKYGAHLNGAILNENIENEENLKYLFDPEKHLNVIDQLDVKEFKKGGNPLHWIKNAQCVELFLEMNCKIDAKNFKGETPLHTFVLKKNLGIVMSLLWHGAEVNSLNSNDQTPLHLAVRTGDISVVQALIVFGANVNLKDSLGCTVRHICSTEGIANNDTLLYILHTVDAKRCQRNIDGQCSDGCAKNGTFNGKNKDSPYHRASSTYEKLLFSEIIDETLKFKKELSNISMEIEGKTERKKKRVLCLDGGGIRGLILIQMLSIMEQIYELKTYQMFDIISGTSTGSICALSFSLGKSAKECRKLYFRLKDKIFTGSRPYDVNVFENFLKQEFGELTKMSDIQSIKVLIPALIANQFPPDLHLFRNYESPQSVLGEEEVIGENDHFIWYCARSSGAAPTYFTSCDKYIDGGLISNNPTLDTLTEITALNNAYKVTKQYQKEFGIDVVVSLGTGDPPVVPIQTPNIVIPTSLFEMTKIFQSYFNLFDLLREQSTQSNGQVVKRCSAWCYGINVPFFRLNPPISENISMNETDNAKLVKMLWETTAYMYNRKEDLDKLKNIIS